MELKQNPVKRKTKIKSEATDIVVHLKKDTIVISPKTIMLLEGLGNYTIVHTESGHRFMISRTLKSVSQNLEKNFIRVHKGYIINCNFIISRIDDDRLLKLTGGKEITVSRRKVKETTLLLDSI